MKFLPYFLVLAWCLSGCQSDEDGADEDPIPNITGTWLLTEWYDDVPRDINNDGVASNDLLAQWNGCKKYSKLVLNENGTGEIIYIGPSDNPNCPDGFKTNDSFGSGPWEVDDPPYIFSLIGDDFVDSYIIESLTEQELILQGSGFMTCCDESISHFTGGYLKFTRQ